VVFNRSVTVIIPTIPGREDLLRAATQSVLDQTEWVAHPEQAFPGYVMQLDRDREGATTTRNKALQRVTTEWVAFLDDDDILYPDHLQACLDAAEQTGADLVYPYPDFAGQRDPLATLQNGRVVSPFGVPFGPEQEWWLRHRGGFIPVTHVVRRELVTRVGGFPQPGRFRASPGNISSDCEDFGLLLHLLDAGAQFHHLPERTWLYRLHDANTGGRPPAAVVA
jgi:glycosyltransferase involved in cell wall biosynthesis